MIDYKLPKEVVHKVDFILEELNTVPHITAIKVTIELETFIQIAHTEGIIPDYLIFQMGVLVGVLIKS